MGDHQRPFGAVCKICHLPCYHVVIEIDRSGLIHGLDCSSCSTQECDPIVQVLALLLLGAGAAPDSGFASLRSRHGGARQPRRADGQRDFTPISPTDLNTHFGGYISVHCSLTPPRWPGGLRGTERATGGAESAEAASSSIP